MPIISSSYRKRPFYLPGAHLETVIPSMFFKTQGVTYQRERLELPDGDFLDIDWLANGSSKCLIITHGLEGSADRHYVKRTARYFEVLGWDVAAWNCRSCSGQMNRLPRFYHHGDTEDLHAVINQVLGKGYEEVVLLGYSMGGSMTLKYLGERSCDERIRSATVFSVPCNLRDSAIQLTLPGNQFYEKRFVKKLLKKIQIKAEQHPQLDVAGLDQIQSFDEFHERYTAPLHGFTSMIDFFEKSTCDQFFHSIQVPVLIVNAANDPMLGPLCYPYEAAEKYPNIFLEVPKLGGHVGFTMTGKAYSYMELAAGRFLKEQAIL